MKHKPLHLALVSAILCSVVATGYSKMILSPQAEEEALARHMSPKDRLGRLLFNDTHLSEPAGQSCASCHDANFAATDPDQSTPTSQGVNPRLFGSRNTPTAMYAAFSPAFHTDEEGLYVGGQFLDGRAATLEDQAKGPFLNPLEMANASRQQVVDKVRSAEYAHLFRKVYGQDIFDDIDAAYDGIADAIAAFERTRAFNKFTSKFDAHLAGKAKLTEQELRGMELFEREDKGNCAACHPNTPDQDGNAGVPPLLTDFTYDNLGVPKNPDNRFYKMKKEFNPDGRQFVDRGLGGVVGIAAEDGKFKVPTLRNIALTAPYMHNGYFTTLKGVVDFYNTRDTKPVCPQAFLSDRDAIRKGCWPAAEVAANVNSDELGNLGLTDQEVDDIVAFMQTLTDGWMPVKGH
ncbi:MAG: c-type cytochrome [Thiobacillaceae bacterium]|jgi:cytochrome c peroxidase|nr:c-type cytochrome [Thiobacillaceae bacterium]